MYVQNIQNYGRNTLINLIDIVKPYEAIFVDLDNTLFNYSYAHNMALDAVFNTFNVNNEDYNKAKHEIKTRELQSNHHKKELYFKIIAENNKLPLLEAYRMFELYERVFNDNLLADTSMLNMFKYAKKSGKTIIAITNYYVVPQMRKLQSSGFIDYIDAMVTSEEFEIEKPSKKLFDKAMSLAGNPEPSKVIMFGDSVVDNLTMFNIDYYPYNCSKLLISISGKSGAGKTTLSKVLQNVWDASVIEGDGYHKYERNHPEWKNVTHYNPNANNLIQLGLDIKQIYQSIGNINVPIYNHKNGLFDSPLELNHNSLDVVLIEGLHTLYKEVTGDYVKIKIYLDNELSDEQKIKRDTIERSKTKDEVLNSINQREEDFNKYIDIQKEFSNFLITINRNGYIIKLSDGLSYKGKTEITGEREELEEMLTNIMLEFKENRYTKEG